MVYMYVLKYVRIRNCFLILSKVIIGFLSNKFYLCSWTFSGVDIGLPERVGGLEKQGLWDTRDRVLMLDSGGLEYI